MPSQVFAAVTVCRDEATGNNQGFCFCSAVTAHCPQPCEGAISTPFAFKNSKGKATERGQGATVWLKILSGERGCKGGDRHAVPFSS